MLVGAPAFSLRPVLNKCPALQKAESHRDKAQIATKVIKAIVTLFIQWYHRDQQMMWHILQFCFLLLLLSVADPSASTA